MPRSCGNLFGWQRAVEQLSDGARASRTLMALSIYPWEIVDEMERRVDHPQAMLLVVPNGKVKLLNALSFAPADLRRDSIDEAWNAIDTRGGRPACASLSPAATSGPSYCAMRTRRGR